VEVQLERNQKYLLLRVSGDLRLAGQPQVQETLLMTFLSGLAGSVPQHLVLSLRGLTHLDSSGVRALVRVAAECSNRQIGVRVVLPPGAPGDVLRLTRVFERWPTFDEEAAALPAAEA